MTQIIPTLLSITKGAFLTAGLIILLRLVLKNVLSAKAKYYLWLLLALRLMLPTLPESPWSLMNLLPESQAVETETADMTENVTDTALPALAAPIPDIAEAPTAVTKAPAMTAVFYPEPETAYSLTPEGWILIIWLGGMAVISLGYVTLYTITGLRLKKLPDCHDEETLEILRSLKRKLGIRRDIRLAFGGGGMLGGIFRPTIVLPAECYGQGAKPILLHELLHYKYKDLWLYLLFRLLTVIHWFNPLVWLCFRQARQDSEAACDQRVMDSGMVETIAYAQTLYREGVLSRRDRMLMQTSFGSTNHNLRRRIAAISKYSGKHLWVTILAICLTVVICACTLTGKEAEQPEESMIDPTAESSVYTDPLSEETNYASSLDDTSMDTTIYSPYRLEDDQDTFFAQFHELDKRSMLDYVEENPDVLKDGWSQVEINQAGLDDSGTGIMTTNGHEVLAIDAKNGILLLRVYCDDSRGVMAIMKDSTRLVNAPASTIGASGQTVGTICNDAGGLLAINGSAFLDDGNSLGSQLSGLAVHNGKAIGESLGENYKRLELRDDGRMYIMDSASPLSENTLEACEFKPALIVDGQILVDENCGWISPSPRTVIGQSERLETMMVVIEGRMLDSPGCSVVDIAELMAEYGCAQALNLDGGTSSIMYYKGEYITRCSNTTLPEGREIPTAWVYR